MSKKTGRAAPKSSDTESDAATSCVGCGRALAEDEKALFVEEEVGRVFCKEDCISEYFMPEIKKLEREYVRNVPRTDLSAEEKERYSHLRFVTLQEPDEVWRQTLPSGDRRYTLISKFTPGKKPVWCVCICLMLRGEPSFLFIAFPSQSPSLVNHFRKGERLEEGLESSEAVPTEFSHEHLDGLAQDGWSPEESLRAEISQARSPEDIPLAEFPLYESFLEPTLQAPKELWSYVPAGDEARVYHFIRSFEEAGKRLWYVAIARESTEGPEGEEFEMESDEHLELLDYFPTRDAELVDRLRVGEPELEEAEISDERIARQVH